MLLTPQDPLLSVAVDGLQSALGEAGFIGGPLPGIPGGFLAGERFLSLIIFAGCSVRIELAPPADHSGKFCHVRFSAPFARPILRHGRNTRAPRCPNCRTPHREWRGFLFHADRIERDALVCAACGAKRPPWDWDWKGNAGFGRTFVSVEEVFPGEATPVPGLTDVLEGVAGAPWRHFYLQD